MKRFSDTWSGTIHNAPLLAIAASVKLSSPGPVLFRQRRYGLGERRSSSQVSPERRRQLVSSKRGLMIHVTRFGFLPYVAGCSTIITLAGTYIVGPRPHAVAHNEASQGHRGPMVPQGETRLPAGWINVWADESVEKMARIGDLDYPDGRSGSIWNHLQDLLWY
jgi:putative colanic acid biosynthesis UDP-glucose lipid carrier transferase